MTLAMTAGKRGDDKSVLRPTISLTVDNLSDFTTWIGADRAAELLETQYNARLNTWWKSADGDQEKFSASVLNDGEESIKSLQTRALALAATGKPEDELEAVKLLRQIMVAKQAAAKA